MPSQERTEGNLSLLISLVYVFPVFVGFLPSCTSRCLIGVYRTLNDPVKEQGNRELRESQVRTG